LGFAAEYARNKRKKILQLSCKKVSHRVVLSAKKGFFPSSPHSSPAVKWNLINKSNLFSEEIHKLIKLNNEGNIVCREKSTLAFCKSVRKANERLFKTPLCITSATTKNSEIIHGAGGIGTALKSSKINPARSLADHKAPPLTQ